jgi:hypothetical protein
MKIAVKFLLNTSAMVEIELVDKLPRLFIADIASKKDRIAIEVLDNFLERRISGLDIEFPDDSEFEGEPADIHEVVFPRQSAEGNWIDVTIEEKCKVDSQE